MKKKNLTILLLTFFSVNMHAQVYIKPLFDFSPQQSSFKFPKNQNYNGNRMLRFYMLSGYREGVNPISGPFGLNYSATHDKTLGTVRLFMYNLSIAEMLTNGFVKMDRIILEVKDPSKYLYSPNYGSKQLWLRKNAHCFELMQPDGTLTGTSLNDVLADIFGINFGMEKRNVKALILKSTLNKKKYTSDGIGATIHNKAGRLRNVSIHSLIDSIGYVGMPFIDETGYSGSIDIDLKLKSWNDLDKIKKSLRNYNLELKEEMRELELFVIKERKNYGK